ncbi:MAG TPA: type IV pilus assembly protein PilM [Gaiellaceae bacterium]|jgi:type IV pilus assembly protein PilM|nr:type IV pilus assembly protein PilM [Gaiellaceae bacterium]
MEDQNPNFAADDARRAESPPPAVFEPAAAPVAEESLGQPPLPGRGEDAWAARPAPAPTIGGEPTAAAVPARHEVEPTPPPPLYDPVAAEAPAVDWSASHASDEEIPEPVAEPAAAPERKQPIWKREISLGRKQSSGGSSKPKQESEPKQAKAASPKKPLLKRELRLGRPARGPKKQKAPSAKRVRSGVVARGGSVKKIVGLTIGSSQLAAAEVSNNGHAEILKLAQRPLKRGTVVGGELRDIDVLTHELKEFFREHRLPQRNVRLGIASNRIGVRIIDVEGVEDGKQLENAVRFRAQEVLPIPIDQAVLDHIVLDEHEHDGVFSRRILLVVAYRESVDRYVAACNAAGLRLVGIDLEAFGLLRALGKPNGLAATEVETADVVVALGHDRSILAVSAHGICEFTRVFEWGGFALDVAVSRELDLTPSAAEPTRTAIGVGGALVPGGLNPEHAAAARTAMQRQLHGFARELVSSLQFYQDQPGSLGFGEIVLAGGLAQTPGIDQELQRLIGVPVRVGNPLELAKHGKRVAAHEHLPALAGAIGLGMEV